MMPETVRLLFFAAVFALIYLVETFRPARAWAATRGRRLRVHAGVAVLNTVLMRLVAAVPFLFLLGWANSRGFGIRHLIGLEGGAEVAVSVVAFDAFDYVWHRANHEVAFLWRFHRAHHQDTHVDVTTSLRFHPGELIFSTIAKSLWIVFWGPSLWGFVAGETAVTAFSQFHHGNFSFPRRWEEKVRLVWMTPRLHASHHTVSTRTRTANYSTVFLLWDRLWGTLREPDDAEMKTLGLPDDREDDLSLRHLLAIPFARSRPRGVSA